MRESEGSTIVLVHVVQRGYTASVKRLYRLTSAKLRGTALRFHSNLAESGRRVGRTSSSGLGAAGASMRPSRGAQWLGRNEHRQRHATLSIRAPGTRMTLHNHAWARWLTPMVSSRLAPARLRPEPSRCQTRDVPCESFYLAEGSGLRRAPALRRDVSFPGAPFYREQCFWDQS